MPSTREHAAVPRVSLECGYEVGARMYLTCVWGSTRISLGCAPKGCMRLLVHARWGACIFLVHACLGLCSCTRRCRRLDPLLCTLVQCRCGHSSPKDVGV